MTEQEFIQRYHYNPSTDKLGAGGFGQVYKAYDTVLDREVAIKMAAVIDGKENLSLMKEVELASKLPQHANIAHYEKCFRLNLITGKTDIGILQYYPEGSLATIIKQGALTDDQREDVIKGILDGLEFLHGHKVLHRDLKPGNILIAKRGNQYIPKIADFGLSRQLDSLEQSSFVNSFVGGSAYYAAPEQLAGEKVSKNVDLWSLGVILYELMTGDRPFTATATRSETEDARQEIYSKIKRGDIPSKIDAISEPAQSMIRACLIPDRKRRIQDIAGLRSIIAGDKPDDIEYEKTVIDSNPNSSTTTKQRRASSEHTFSQSSTTKIKDREQTKTKQTRKKNKSNAGKSRIISIVGGIVAAIAAIAVYVLIPLGGSDVSEEQLWIAALSQKDSSSYIAILDAYPNGQYVGEASVLLDSIRLEVVVTNQAEVAALQKADEEEEEAWAPAQEVNTISAYQAYLNMYPNGKYADLASFNKDSLKKEKEKIVVIPRAQMISNAKASIKKRVESYDDEPRHDLMRFLLLQADLTLHKLAIALYRHLLPSDEYKIQDQVLAIANSLNNESSSFLEKRTAFEENNLSRKRFADLLPYLVDAINAQNFESDSFRKQSVFLGKNDLEIIKVLGYAELIFDSGRYDSRFLANRNSQRSVLNLERIINESIVKSRGHSGDITKDMWNRLKDINTEIVKHLDSSKLINGNKSLYNSCRVKNGSQALIKEEYLTLLLGVANNAKGFNRYRFLKHGEADLITRQPTTLVNL